MKRRNVLFITWDGPDTFYLEGLFVPLFVQLRSLGFSPHVLQFSWGEQAIHERRGALCSTAGIPYRYVRVCRRAGGVGAFMSAYLGRRHILRAMNDWQIDTLLPRSLMPALGVLGLSRTVRQAVSVVFDADGLAADERVDFGGLSPHGLTYRVLRDIEAEMLRQADVVLCRTEAAKNILVSRAGAGAKSENYHVVSNGKNPGPFAECLESLEVRGTDTFRLCYCGSIGLQYRLPEMLEIAVFLKQKIPTLTFEIFSSANVAIEDEVQRIGLTREDWISWRSLSSDLVPAALAECDLALALRHHSFSMQAVQPIKYGEYLLAGLPILGTPGIGDTNELIKEGVFRSAEMHDREETLGWILDNIISHRASMRKLCHEAGKKYFSVEGSANQYAAALSTF